MLGPSNLASYQTMSIDFMYRAPYSGLWQEMGLGKTVAVLSLLARLLAGDEAERILIVAPLRVALQTWPNEIGKWSHTKDIPFTVIRHQGDEPEILEARANAKAACKILGMNSAQWTKYVARATTRAEKRVRTALLHSDTPIHIINQDALPWLVDYFGKSFPYDTVIFDESSGLRDHKSERFLAMKKARKYAKRMHQLTGTPAPETYLDLFPQIYLMDLGERFGRAVTPFRQAYFTQNPYNRSYTIRPGMADVILDKLHGIVLVMKARDYLPLSEPVFIDVDLTMTKPEKEQYDRLESDFILQTPDGFEIEAENAASLWQKLLQYASGAVYDTERTTHHFHNHKIDALRQIRDEAQGQPILVAYWFMSSLARLKKAFPDGQAMDMDGKMVGPWNAGKIPMLFLHPRGAGHGLNLQEGGHVLVWFDICYPLELYLQTVARLARQGQKEVVRVYHLVMRGTLDELIVPKLKAKEESQNYLFARLKMLRERARQRKADRNAKNS